MVSGLREGSRVHVNYASIPPETPPAPGQPRPSKAPRKRLYVALGIIAVIAVALALSITFLNGLNVNSSSTGSTIPLSYNYTPGEEMTYNITETMSTGGQNTSMTGVFRMDVVSFDGTNYIINVTSTESIPGAGGGLTINSTVTEIMSKAGYATLSNGMNGTQCPLFGSVGSFFQKDKATVGETWQFPMSFGNQTVSYNGTFTYTFGSIQTITVPAGTYKVFSINMSSDDITFRTGILPSNSTMLQNVTAKGQAYFEYGTCCSIESSIQETMPYESNGIDQNETINLQMTLVKYTKP